MKKKDKQKILRKTLVSTSDEPDVTRLVIKFGRAAERFEPETIIRALLMSTAGFMARHTESETRGHAIYMFTKHLVEESAFLVKNADAADAVIEAAKADIDDLWTALKNGQAGHA